jgi:hypothetical protein
LISYNIKKSIFNSFPELNEKIDSLNRIDYVYPKSKKRGKILATEIHSSGNGYVIGKYINADLINAKGYQVDSRGWIKIKDFSHAELQEIISIALDSMNNEAIEIPEITQRIPNEVRVRTLSKDDAEISFSKSLVESCLYNWLGYGQVNSPIWFMGMEEGGAEVWRNKTKTLKQSLEIRSKFSIQMDFQNVWEDLYRVELDSFKGPTVWRFMAAFLLELENSQVNAATINDFLFSSKKLGRVDSNHFLAELLPLPKPSRASIEPYQSIWKSVLSYEDDVKEKRFKLIKEMLIKNLNVNIIVSYDRNLTEMIYKYFSINVEKTENWKFNKEQYYLHEFNLTDDRKILLLVTPFFGNGQISYEGLLHAARRVKKLNTGRIS